MAYYLWYLLLSGHNNASFQEQKPFPDYIYGELL